MSRCTSILKPVALLALGCLMSCRSRSPENPASAPVPTPVPTPAPIRTPRLPQRGNSVTDFERLANWMVESTSGNVELLRNPEQSLWGSGSAELNFVPDTGGAHRITLTPDEPWRIPTQFDTIVLWIQHGGESWIREDHFIQIQYRDKNGLHGEWTLPYQPRAGWQMLHVRVDGPVPYPVSVVSLQWVLPERISGPQRMWLDSLSIYQEVLGQIPKRVDYVRPHGYAPAFAPQRKNSVTLDFPTGPAAYRPRTRPERSVQTLTTEGPDTFLFQYESAETTIGYRINAARPFPRVDLVVDGKTYPGLWSQPRVEGPDRIPELRFARATENRLDLQYTEGIQFEFSLHGKTLQIEISSLLETIRSLELGRMNTPQGEQSRILWFPFMRLHEDLRWPVFIQPGQPHPFLITLFPDWWFSLGSRYTLPRETEWLPGRGLGRMEYDPRWRGSLNMFRERLYLTVSRRLLDVLPSPASPRALFSGSPEPLDSGEIDADDSVLHEMNVLSVHPLEPEWEDGLLARSPRGEWKVHPQRGYVMKSGRLDGLPLSRLLSARPEEAAPYLWVPSVGQFPPWRFTDFDVRMIGAGTYTQTLAEAGAFLQQAAAEWGGALLSRGGSEWLWAGLVSGFVPDFPHGLLELHPLLPHVAWRNVHPFSRILGLGDLEDFRLPTDEPGREEVLLDRCLAVQLAYAATGIIPKIEDPGLQAKARRFNEVLHRHLTGKEVDRIAYWTGERFVDAGEALQNDALERSQLYIRLQDQTEIWVNGDLSSEWSLRVDGRELSLPPFGFVLRGQDLFVLNRPKWNDQPGSGIIKQPGDLWLYSPEAEIGESGIRVRGTLRIRQDAAEVITLEFADWRGEVVLSPGDFHLDRIGSIRAYDAEGNTNGGVAMKKVDDSWVLSSEAPLRRVVIYPELNGADLNFSP
ncbi:MAG: hypothetical protein WD708_12295 [Kiritimatiellia bacterium]